MTQPPGPRPETVRPRYGRIAAVGGSVTITAVALLAGVGILPTSAASGPGAASGSSAVTSTSISTGARHAIVPVASTPTPTPTITPTPTVTPTTPAAPVVTALPAHSGHGKRVVYSEAGQRVWLVDADDVVRRTYLVSGSLYDNLSTGTYQVYSRSEQAWGIDDSGTMRWFVRFAHGGNAAIGFHDIPIDNGKQVQTRAELGTPRSHGCVRQKESDAKALWAFAPIGTTVVVV